MPEISLKDIQIAVEDSVMADTYNCENNRYDRYDYDVTSILEKRGNISCSEY